MRARRLATASAAAATSLAVSWLAVSSFAAAAPASVGLPEAAPAELPRSAGAYLVGPECRVRAAGPIDCDRVTAVRLLVDETAAVQLVVEAGEQPLSIVVDGSRARIEEQLFVPVRQRSRGRDPREALPWAAAARPADDTILGEVADPLLVRGAGPVHVPANARRAWWVSVRGVTRGREVVPIVLPGGLEPGGSPVLEVTTLGRRLPPPVVSVFAYLERDEPRLAAATTQAQGCAPSGSGPGAQEAGARALARLLEEHGVLPVDRATEAGELGPQLRVVGDSGEPLRVPRDLVVLGAYGSLGEPTDAAVRRVEEMAAAVPDSVRDVVLYAIDESCESDLGARWRQELRGASGAARRVKVLVTCSEDPTTIDADVVMTTAERFRPALAAAARAQGKEVWVYNGRLPQAGPMALDAPPESMTWLGWIAARHDVRRWFLWNVNHWSDGNRGGHGPRDPYVDPETFHNADGDAVLLDGLLVYPPRAAPCPPGEAAGAPLARSVRLARLARGIEDASLLALAASIDPEAAGMALELVVPRALGDVPDDAGSPFGDGRTLARARAMLHDVIEGSPALEPGEDAWSPELRRTRGQAGIVMLRARAAVLSLEGGAREARSPGTSRGRTAVLAGALAVAVCLGGGVIAAQRLARRRAPR